MHNQIKDNRRIRLVEFTRSFHYGGTEVNEIVHRVALAVVDAQSEETEGTLPVQEPFEATAESGAV